MKHTRLTASTNGATSEPLDISDVHLDWTLKTRIDSLTTGAKVLLAVDDSVDGFVSDVRTICVIDADRTTAQQMPLRAYQHPSARFGVDHAQLRLRVQSVDAGASVTATVTVEY